MSLFGERDPWKKKEIVPVALDDNGYIEGTPVRANRKPNLPKLQPKQNATKNQQEQNPTTVSSAGGGNGQYIDQLNSLYNQIMNRGQFKYDINGDMLYRQMADQYTQLGRQAMMDTMGQAASLTGGYGNSYGSTAGNQQYQQYLTALNNNIPELYDRALVSWQAQGDELLKQYQLAAQHQATLDAMKPRTVYATKKEETSAGGTQDKAGYVDPSYLGAVYAFINGQASALNGKASGGYMAGQSESPASTTQTLNNYIGNVDGTRNPLQGFYEKNYESMKTGGTNQQTTPATPTNGSASFQSPLHWMDYENMKDKYRKK